MFLFSVMLVFILTPGIAFTIPQKSSKYVVALVHSLLFALVLYCANNLFLHASEGFSSLCNEGYDKCLDKNRVQKIVIGSTCMSAQLQESINNRFKNADVSIRSDRSDYVLTNNNKITINKNDRSPFPNIIQNLKKINGNLKP